MAKGDGLLEGGCACSPAWFHGCNEFGYPGCLFNPSIVDGVACLDFNDSWFYGQHLDGVVPIGEAIVVVGALGFFVVKQLWVLEEVL